MYLYFFFYLEKTEGSKDDAAAEFNLIGESNKGCKAATFVGELIGIVNLPTCVL